MALSFTLDGHAQDNAAANNIVYTMVGGIAVGDRIIVIGNIRGGPTVSSISDSKSNTYAVNGTAGGVGMGSAHCTTALVAGDTVTVTFTGSNTGHCIIVGSISGQANPAFDKTKGATGSSSPASTGNSATTTQADEIVIGTAGVVGVAVTEDATFTNFENFTLAAGAVTQIAGYKIVSATGAQAYAPTFSGTHNWGSLLCTYKQYVSQIGVGLLNSLALQPRRLVG